MLRASGIILLVFFCYLSGVSQGLETNTDVQLTDSGSIRTYNSLSRQFLAREPEKALDFSTKALEAARRLDFKPGIAESMANLGQFYLDQGNTGIALEYFNSYQQIAAEMQDSLLLADAYTRLGTLHRQQRRLDQALAYYKDAIQIAEERRDYELMGKCYKHIGGVYYYQKEYTLANRYFFRSIQYLPQTDNAEYAAVLNNIGVVFKAEKKYREALVYFKQVLEIVQTLHNIRDASVVMMHIGEIYQLYNDYDLAEMYYLQALEAARQVHAMERIAETHQNLARLYEDKEDYKRAYQSQSLVTAYKDTLARLEQHISLEEANKKLETERSEKLFSQFLKDKELELLNEEYKVSRLKISQKNSLILLIGAVSLLVSMLAVVFYQRNQLKKRQNQQLEDENQHTYSHNQQLQIMNEKLRKSELELKCLNETKDKFFSIISHDLRSPLYTLAGFIQIMKKDIGSFSAEEISRFSIQMERSLQGVTSLLDNLFQWATQQSGLIQFAPAEFKLNKIVDESIQLLQATANLKKISLQQEVGDIKLKADVQMIRLILRNLLANAIKFTGKEGKVWVSATAAEGEVVIIVADNGIGISEKDQKKLFGKKSIYTQRGTENEKGSGLGLLLCKEFIELHQGRIEVKSSPGKGTSFIIYLPQHD